ncbi:hypothetical protein [Phocaeicola barnesiae]|uniref:hypothetical protein n=1 Tax=Phocaeicola barnesiae TaxID=376804 RepID=UPI00242F97DE|nr:hypothetical protein [Phocaeicola barnesiae]
MKTIKTATMKKIKKATTTMADIKSKTALKNQTTVNSDCIENQRIKCVGKLDMNKVIVSPTSTPLSPRSSLLKLIHDIWCIK